MKHKKNSLLLLLMLGFLFGNAQCSFDTRIDECTQNLGAGYTFIKMYDLKAKELNNTQKVEFSNVLSKGNTYKFQTCLDENNNEIKVKLFDRSRRLIASNYDDKKRKFYSAISYKCKATSIYYLEFENKNSFAECSYGVLSFL